MSAYLRAARRQQDEGAILVMVLVMMVIGALIILPLLVYTVTVFRAGRVQTDKAEAVELARGATWVALSNQEDLYDLCTGGVLPASLPSVSTTCEVVQTETLRPAAEIPYHVSLIQANVAVPPQIASPSTDYPSPNSTAVDPGNYDAWLDAPDWSWSPLANKVWVPQLPVRATSAGGLRDTSMIPGTEDPLYAGKPCRVFFPGTFTAPIDIDTPAYFTSGVYYFTQPITLRRGADVVVGNGAAGGCTTDFEAIANAVTVPDPLNMSGLGGTFVLGENARIIVDDTGTGNVRLAMNQRYVSADETSVAASLNVSIVSVNGTHAPLVGAEALGQELVVNGVTRVPASTVGTAGNPLATASGYSPSVFTPKPTAPDTPTNLSAVAWQRGSAANRGRLVVTWDIPNNNGSLITSYRVTDATTGLWCSPPPPILPDTKVQPTCTIVGLPHQTGSNESKLTITATNAVGTSAASPVYTAPRVRLSSSPTSPVLTTPTAPLNPAVTSVHNNGLVISWTPPASNGGAPITRYRVTATPVVPSPGTVVTCEAWWDETSCVLPGGGGPGTLLTGSIYQVQVVAIQSEGGSPIVEYGSPPAFIDGNPADNLLPPPNPEPDPVVVALTGGPAPVQIAAVAAPRVPLPILDFTTVSTATTDIWIAGYVSVPQGRIEITAVNPASLSVSMIGGVVAGKIEIGPTVPASRLDVRLDNPVAQKRVRIVSTTSGSHQARSDAIVQVNRSGSIAVNSWIVQ